jgi:hypothetical protein
MRKQYQNSIYYKPTHKIDQGIKAAIEWYWKNLN